MGASEYKHVVVGPIFLKYVEDAIEERRAVLPDELAADVISSDTPRSSSSPARSTPTDRMESRAELQTDFADR